MIEDRRKYPRYPMLIRCTLVTPRDRRDAVCTQIGPAGAFLTGRLEQLLAGEIVRVEMRSGGLGTPIITLLGLIVRVQMAAAGNAGGLAVRWRAAACELGPEPLAHFLVHVLRLPTVPEIDLSTDRHVQFDLEASLAGHHVLIFSPRSDAMNRSASEAVRASAARSASFAAVARPSSADTTGQRPVIAPRKEFGLLDDPLAGVDEDDGEVGRGGAGADLRCVDWLERTDAIHPGAEPGGWGAGVDGLGGLPQRGGVASFGPGERAEQWHGAAGCGSGDRHRSGYV